jgi:hypothetical protein
MTPAEHIGTLFTSSETVSLTVSEEGHVLPEGWAR